MNQIVFKPVQAVQKAIKSSQSCVSRNCTKQATREHVQNQKEKPVTLLKNSPFAGHFLWLLQGFTEQCGRPGNGGF